MEFSAMRLKNTKLIVPFTYHLRSGLNKVEANNIISSILTLPAYRQAGSAAVRADESRNISKV